MTETKTILDSYYPVLVSQPANHPTIMFATRRLTARST